MPTYYIIVEGAPDVLRMQSIGYDNTVASLGTAWSDNQFEQLKRYVSSLCFIPDSDIAEGKPYGPGFEAVMTNGAAAIRKGFHVTVRELPFAEIPSEAEGEVQYAKNDPTAISAAGRIILHFRKSISLSGLHRNVFW